MASRQHQRKEAVNEARLAEVQGMSYYNYKIFIRS